MVFSGELDSLRESDPLVELTDRELHGWSLRASALTAHYSIELLFALHCPSWAAFALFLFASYANSVPCCGRVERIRR